MDRVEFRVVTAADVDFPRGLPVVRDMDARMIEACPNASAYTYANGDIIGTHDFVETVDAVSRVEVGWNFLMVGRRTDVPWSEAEAYDATEEGFDFIGHYIDRGRLFVPYAEDYFTVTRDAINWTGVPPFVVGRPGYDIWLVDHAHHKHGVAVVDATKTVPMIHQTDENGNFSWGGGIGDKASLNYNFKFASRKHADHGLTDHADFETHRDRENGYVHIRRKRRNVVAGTTRRKHMFRDFKGRTTRRKHMFRDNS